MPWTLYQASDAGAPSLSGQAGSLLEVLDACLVTGYGAKPAAGWTIAFTDGDKRVYRPGPSAKSRKFVRVNDTASLPGGARETGIRGFDSMTDIDTGVHPFPDNSQVSLSENSLVIRKSASSSAVARFWRVFADDRTAILFLDHDSSSPPAYLSAYIGEYFSYLPNDTHGFCLIARQHENDTMVARENLPSSVASQATPTGNLLSSWPGQYLAGSVTGMASSVGFSKVGGVFGRFASLNNLGSSFHDVLGGVASLPNPTDGSILLAPFLMTTSESGQNCLRGHLRGIYQFCHVASGVNDGDTFAGTGDLAGRSFMLCKRVYTRNVSQGSGDTMFTSGAIAVELTSPPVTP